MIIYLTKRAWSAQPPISTYTLTCCLLLGYSDSIFAWRNSGGHFFLFFDAHWENKVDRWSNREIVFHAATIFNGSFYFHTSGIEEKSGINHHYYEQNCLIADSVFWNSWVALKFFLWRIFVWRNQNSLDRSILFTFSDIYKSAQVLLMQKKRWLIMLLSLLAEITCNSCQRRWYY